MDNNQDKSLENRVQRLEQSVADLIVMVQDILRDKRQGEQKSVHPVQAPPIPPPPPPPMEPQRVQAPPPPRPAPPPQQSFGNKMQASGFSLELPVHMRSIEFWLNKVGIGLVLFAVVFLFKYSIDKGWLTPWVRVYCGLALGVVLIVLGYRTYAKRRHFSLVFLGGGIATFYITAFAAFQRLALVSHTSAFAFMVFVTIFALALSLKQNDSVLSLLGAIGGFGTPFMLYTGSGDIPGLVTYTCILIAAMMAMYFYKGWRSLLWVTVGSGWTIVLIALSSGVLRPDLPLLEDRRAVQAGTLFAFLGFWIVPVLRRLLRPLAKSASDPILQPTFGFVAGPEQWLSVTSPLIALSISHAIWPSLTKETWGWFTMIGAAVYFLASYGLYLTNKVKNLAYTHLLVGALLFTIALCFLLDGDTLFFAIATEATVLHLVALRTQDKGIAIGAHLLFGILTLALTIRLFSGPSGPLPMVNKLALADVWAIAAAIGLSYRFKGEVAKNTYFIAGYYLLAGWFCRELDGTVLFLVLTFQTAVFHVLTYKSSGSFRRIGAHVFSMLLFFWLADRMLDRETTETAIVNSYAIVNFLAIAVAAGTGWISKIDWERGVYAVAAHILFMGWLLSELSTLNEGQGYVTITWGIYGALLLVIGLRRNHHLFRIVALATLFAVVAKLFLVDLANIEPIFRILLFMGFGGVFLGLSYYFRALWKSDQK